MSRSASEKTTYILGAGASKAAWQFPVLDDFLGEALGRSSDCGELGTYIEQRFGDAQHANLEAVLADLDQTLYGLGGVWHAGATSDEASLAHGARTQLLILIAK